VGWFLINLGALLQNCQAKEVSSLLGRRIWIGRSDLTGWFRTVRSGGVVSDGPIWRGGADGPISSRWIGRSDLDDGSDPLDLDRRARV
jgi:hypothetical protein